MKRLYDLHVVTHKIHSSVVQATCMLAPEDDPFPAMENSDDREKAEHSLLEAYFK